MVKVFYFGKYDFEGKGKINSVEIEICLQDKKDGKVFTASGRVWNRTHTDCIMGGQCLDEIADNCKEIANDATFKKIYKFWTLYHLNDMHPECEHQNALGWKELAHKKITFYHYKMNRETANKQSEIEKFYKDKFLNGEAVKANADDLEILNLKYFIDTFYELKEDKAKYYTLEKTEEKTCGWVNCDEHEDGILTKACPVCGYKYGTAWKMLQIPAKDLKEIEKLFEK